jgi:hypothetical protein
MDDVWAELMASMPEPTKRKTAPQIMRRCSGSFGCGLFPR